MPEEIQLKLVFANDHNSVHFHVALNTSVKDVKGLILNKHWPASAASPSLLRPNEVERLRLFAAGKELGGKGQEDSKSLKDEKILVSRNGPTPVHVMPVKKEVASEEVTAGVEDTSKPPSAPWSPCFCVIS
eukprot:TRINITY_DN13189_c0_g1_i1.p1 TRINITY_DN13189_c0_g1~~TRINITY_DN13189_c0_g1_i1.p1  ORF type:complete len:131 (+),score=21.05 TRINITY_DN13189_c0_g1_i1:108-500(+)